MIEFTEYTHEFLDYSWKWLNDSEIKRLTMTQDFDREQQKEFYLSLKNRDNYKIYGIKINDIPVGACGLKNINENEAEYWGYIGEKKYWGKGYGKQIIDEMIKYAQDTGIKTLYLKVGFTNIRAIKLYSKIGFKVDEIKSNKEIIYMNYPIS